MQGIERHLVAGDVAAQVLVGPEGERVVLGDATVEVGLLERQRGPLRPLRTALNWAFTFISDEPG